MSPEGIRFVIWDLDETFWRGTLTEGGITDYVQAHHDIVIELARRGIMSGICSKNEHERIKEIFVGNGLWDYFIFPSINWESKGPRLKKIIEVVGLRPPTVLFIDDNPGNLAEAQAAVPGLQVADETCIAGLLGDPRFTGKSDPDLTRLAQYRVLEAKHKDQLASSGDNIAFLRSSDIRVTFDYDVEANIDRAVELINRTNQLNYTKWRLPDEPEAARAALQKQISPYHRQAALIRVTDRYGDYGYVGFFLRDNGQGSGTGALIHYCLSCRTLGMLVERWVYDQLGRPPMRISGEVLTDLDEGAPVDWISFASQSEKSAVAQRRLPEVRLRGGCEVDSIAHYFSPVADKVCREGSFNRDIFFVPKDFSHHLHRSVADIHPTYLEAALASGFKERDLVSDLLGPSEPGTLFVYSGWTDIAACFRHRETGRLLDVPSIPGALMSETQAQLNARYDIRQFDDAKRAMADASVYALRAAFDPVAQASEEDIRWGLANVFGSIPDGCLKACLAIDEVAKANNVESTNAKAVFYNGILRDVALEQDVRVFDIAKHVVDARDRIYTGHFDRIVYYRLATEIIDWATEAMGHLHQPHPDARHVAQPQDPLSLHDAGANR